MIDKLAWIYIKDRKVLCCRSKNKDTFYTPGGKREGNETDKEALVREIKEELSVDLNLDSIKYYDTFKRQAHGKSEGVFVQMTCYTADYVGNLLPDNEIVELAWLDYQDLDKLSLVGNVIFEDLYNKGLID